MRSMYLAGFGWVLCFVAACASGTEGKGAPDVPGDSIADALARDGATEVLDTRPADSETHFGGDGIDCDQKVCFDCQCPCAGDCGGCFSVCERLPPGVEDCSCCGQCEEVTEEDADVVEADIQGPPDPPLPKGTCAKGTDCLVLPLVSCCPPPPNPCTTKPVVGNAADLDALEEWKQDTCEPQPECPDYAQSECDTCYDLVLYSTDCVYGHCVVAEQMDCDAVCLASAKDPGQTCPFISDLDLVNGDTIELCGCFIITECDPIAQTGCSLDEKCTLTKGKPDCKPLGFQPKNSPCIPESDTCAAGLLCNPLNWCSPICTEDYQCENEGYEFCNKSGLGPLYGYCMVYL